MEEKLEQYKLIAKELFKQILEYKRYGQLKLTYIDGQSNISLHKNYYRIGAKLETKHLDFHWNEDNEYCERSYDAFGVIDDCPKFNEWVAYAEKLEQEYAAKHNVQIDLTLEGIKYEIILDVTIKKALS